MSLDQILINMIIVSVPEELLMTLIALLLIGRYDLIDMYNIKTSLKKMMIIVVIPCSIIYSYNLYVLELNLYIRVLINMMVFYVLMLALLKSKEWLKVAITSMLSMFIIIISELTMNIVLIYVFNFNTSVFKVNPWINFVVDLPVRLIQFSIIYMFYLKKNALVSVSILSIWAENLRYRRLIFLCMSIDVIICCFIYNKFALERGIEALAMDIQMVIIFSLFILLILNIVIPWVAVLVTYPSGMYKRKIRNGG